MHSKSVTRFLPILTWGRSYNREVFFSDALAAVIVTIMLVPQSLAYALLAGLPAEVGLYASILPLIAYAIFGTSRTLAVGPVAVVSLMTAATLGNIATAGSADYATAAISLAAISGLMLLLFGIFRLGFLANFLSHPVIAGFITASGILIAAGQLKHIFGIQASGENVIEISQAMFSNIASFNRTTMIIGVASIVALLLIRNSLKPVLLKVGFNSKSSELLARTGPILVLVVSALAAWHFGLGAEGVKLVGHVPKGLPDLAMPNLSLDMLSQLALPALLISVVGFVESISVAQTLAAKRRQSIDPDQELIGLGASNIASSLSGGFPVTGGFARSIVNFDAGAATPAAGAFTAIGLALATLYLTPLLAFLPQATLAATIIVAVMSLVDVSILNRTWTYAKSDFAAVAATILLTLGVGVEAGIVAGVALSILIHLYRTSKPHIAIVGRVAGTEHFRNVKRHDVETDPAILSMRVDESLYFANARYLESQINQELATQPLIKHVVLMCPAVNDIDMSALERLESITAQLKEAGVKLHLSEVKGPVMDKLQRSGFLPHLTGEVFLSHHQAIKKLQSK